MHPTFAFSCRRFVVWLLVGLVPLQAIAMVAMAAAGPSHSHAAPAQLVLDDFRRAPAIGHVHDGEVSERHHHAAGDETVVVDDAEALQADAGDRSTSPSFGVLVGLIPASMARLGAATSAAPAATPRWAPQTHLPALPDRPPRLG